MSELLGEWRTMAGRSLPLMFEAEGDALVVLPSGELDCETSGSLPALLMSSVHDETTVIVDLRRLAFLDAAGLRALLICEARLAQRGVGFRLRNALGEVARLFEITSTTYLLEPC